MHIYLNLFKYREMLGVVEHALNYQHPKERQRFWAKLQPGDTHSINIEITYRRKYARNKESWHFNNLEWAKFTGFATFQNASYRFSSYMHLIIGTGRKARKIVLLGLPYRPYEAICNMMAQLLKPEASG